MRGKKKKENVDPADFFFSEFTFYPFLFHLLIGSLVGAYFIGRQLPYFGPEVYYDVLTSAGNYLHEKPSLRGRAIYVDHTFSVFLSASAAHSLFFSYFISLYLSLSLSLSIYLSLYFSLFVYLPLSLCLSHSLTLLLSLIVFRRQLSFSTFNLSGKEFIDAQAILRSCGLGLFDLRINSLISLYQDRYDHVFYEK